MASSLHAGLRNLKILNIIRLIILLTEAGLLAVADWYFGIKPVWPPVLFAFFLTAILIIYTGLRYQHQTSISSRVLFTQLLCDTLLQTTLLYWSGGVMNPLISAYLLTVAISATLLPLKRRWMITTLTIVCYTLLQNWYQPLQFENTSNHSMTAHGMMGSMMMLHLAGMWLVYSLSACLITGLVASMADRIRTHRAEIAVSRENQLRSERILSVATMAASAAHDLGTTLSTMSVVLGEMADDHKGNAELKDDIALLRSQIEICRSRLAGLVATSQEQKPVVQNAHEFGLQVLDEWQLLRPGIEIGFHCTASQPLNVEADSSLKAALINLLNNAADASPNHVELELTHEEDMVLFKIRDQGAGFVPDISERPGYTTISTKEEGFGLGLQLSAASIEKLNGIVRLYNAYTGNNPEPCGAITEIRLPKY
ncbi:sensor histidine kinase [Endozoicomonas arenosclerae]|uniref:sensor histidine kinase n=1 Tax=Endozoicomonas arenosclerae TaxID=1633495 RepID=UPI0007849859|nr:HAMP domain-containing sensor histidine kinase [Endozoicomonas arenosclerae]